MQQSTIIKLEEGLNYHYEIRNEITNFIDLYNNTIKDTYISIYNKNIIEFINGTEYVPLLSFSTNGVNRGTIYLKEISRSDFLNSRGYNATIQYEIKNIEFDDMVCFDACQIYSKGVVDAVRLEFLTKQIILNIIRK